MPISPTNITKSATTVTKIGKTIPSVYGFAIYGVSIYGYGNSGDGSYTNMPKNSASFFNVPKS